MRIPKHGPRPRLWIVRLQLFIERLIPSPLISSTLIFALPLTIAGVLIFQNTGFRLFTRGVIFALAWLAIAPWLLSLAYRAVAVFFDENRSKFLVDDKAFQELQYLMLRDLGSPRHLLISIPLALICIFVLLNSVYALSPFVVQIWGIVTFGILFFVAGMGFWGISRFNAIFGEICKLDIKFDPYDADGLGGLTFLGQFNVKGLKHFFSGSLLLPFVFEVTSFLPPDEFISLGFFGVVILFMAFGMAGFLVPQMKIKDIVARCKNRCVLQSESVLQMLLTGLCLEKCAEKGQAEVAQIKIDVYYRYFHKRIMAVKGWPFEWKIVLQVISSLFIPVTVAFVEYFLR